ncbi:cardiolipin synthase [Rubinisphaera margarita]|uniref:cardiolipin synthase n=1 Tax=Rubinisphaera margarita TaxID=2909586 RepID=UPI001EE8E45C|nr:cardiolipin synthase [Rubinisphaera margarita]MCG6156558.1 cardiolipin synthase [Rubinisphaera margarita]
MTLFTTALWTATVYAVHLLVAARAILRPHREPASRLAWIIVILVLPVAGIIAYILLGETNVGRRRVARIKSVLKQMPDALSVFDSQSSVLTVTLDERFAHLFRVGETVNGFPPLGGNRGELMADSDAAIDRIVADIDAARENVHLLFYIWLPDNNGMKVVEAVKRAAARGVQCRVMADGLGSRTMTGSSHWQAMKDAGAHCAVALPLGNLLLRPLRGRIDLRNHRKIIVIDNCITYCGSQNCADPEFRVKAKFAPWVDALIRFKGPIVWQNQQLFVSDWMAHVDEDLEELLRTSVPAQKEGFAAQVIGTGPTIRYSAMPEVFENLMYTAREELFITTPYFVPDDSMLSAICASARRGVDTTIIFPARNDSLFVAAASRSYYADMLAAGVKVREYEGGLLHTKSLTIDGEMTLIGSANMDRRSFELNYENNILFHDTELTAAVRERQETYLQQSRTVDPEAVANWPVYQRFFNNAVAMLGPVL